MDNLTALFIRACKSKNPKRRLNSVYRRFYNHGANELDSKFSYRIGEILMDICDQNSLITIRKLLRDLNPENICFIFFSVEKYNYHKCVFDILVSTIRFASVDQLPGLTSPAFFRNKEKENLFVDDT